MNKILFRTTLAEENELEIAKQYFEIINYRSEIKEGDFIIGRYSVLPYYNELEKDIINLGGKLINSYQQHTLIADIQNWYEYFCDITPKTWFTPYDALNSGHNGPFVLKGNINSRKQLWRTHMFAETKKDVTNVYSRLLDDTMLHYQGICVREFVDLINYGDDPITGCPISKEFRLFICNGKIIAKGYYWSNFIEDAGNQDANQIPQDFLNDITDRCKSMANFIIVDVAQKKNGEWIVVELGDAQMGGTSCVDLNELYENLKVAIK